MRIQAFLDGLSRVQRRHGLLLFLALGAALFTADGLRRGAEPLQAPSAAGEGASAAQWLEDEVLYREARARGLDDGDLIVRRRLVQKMRLLLEAGVDVPEPDAATLRRWIDAHPARYGALTRLSFDHVFLSRGQRDSRLAVDAQAVASALESRGDADIAALSDPHPGGTRIDGASARDLERLFGSAFAAQIAELPVGGWQGPLPSSLGLHLLRIRSRELQTPDYAAVHERAQRDYLIEQRRLQTQLALDDLKARYGITADSTLH